MALLWTSEDFLAATNGRPVGEMPQGVTGISIDTRTLADGEAFFAIKGDHLDGHDYLPNAMKAGAALAVVNEDRLVALGRLNLPMVVVNDVMAAMERLGEVARLRSKATVIGVTGSVGKTTVKEMLRNVLSASGTVHASDRSFNNHWGVPLTLSRLPEDARFGVFEIGMNHAGEIASLVKFVRPHIAVVNNVAAVHLGSFESIDDIARAKAEIFTGVVPGGYAVINHDDRRYPMLKNLAQIAGIENRFSFGRKRGSDFWLRSVEDDANGSRISARINGRDVSYWLGIPGLHMALNSVVALGVAELAGADPDKSLEGLGKATAAAGRGNRIVINRPGGRIVLIDESYNANPASMEAALTVLGAFKDEKTKRRIAVLGDMLELGRQSRKLHEELAKPISAAKTDLVFLVGPDSKYLADILPKDKLGGHYENAEQAAAALETALEPGDVVMLKASNGIGFGAVVERITRFFKDR